MSPKINAASRTKATVTRSHHRRVPVAQGVEDLDRKRLHREAGHHVGDDVLVQAEDEAKGKTRDHVGAHHREDHCAEDHLGVGAHGLRGLDDLPLDGLEAERNRDERKRDEEDGMGDDGRHHLSVKPNRGPEREKPQGRDDRRQDEG